MDQNEQERLNDKPNTYEVSVEVIRAFVIEVEAQSSSEAIQKVEALKIDEIETLGEYIDTHVVIDDDPPCIEMS